MAVILTRRDELIGHMMLHISCAAFAKGKIILFRFVLAMVHEIFHMWNFESVTIIRNSIKCTVGQING